MRLVLLSLICVFCPSATMAQVVQWEGNGHYYEYLGEPGGGTPEFEGLSWNEAREVAESREYDGLPGHLVTVTSESEWTFLTGLFVEVLVPSPGIMVGGWCESEWEPVPEGATGWRWLTGEPFDETVVGSGWSIYPLSSQTGVALGASCGLYSHAFVCGFGAISDADAPNPVGFIVEYDGIPLVHLPPEETVSSARRSWSAVKSLYR